MSELRITWCYPDMLNLHGDRGNAMALERVGKLLGLSVTIDRVEDYGDPIDWERSDLLLFDPGEVRTVPRVVDALERQRDGLMRYVDRSGVIVAVGTTGAAFGRKLRRADGQVFDGLGILDMVCTEREEILGDDLIVRLRGSGRELAGCQIQLIDAEVSEGSVLADVVYGYGNHGYEHAVEGAIAGNVCFTNLLGPVFVKNPWWAEDLIRTALKGRGIMPDPLPEEQCYALERKSFDCIRAYCVTDHSRNKSHNPWNRSDR
ncbi:MAG: hypothetical protein IJH75_03920 [Mogibacterium sp.]|nr:hypothetical protein [Mogibacterium sp.]